VRLAVGEACSRAVEVHRRHCPAEPVRIEMTDQGERFVVVVRDSAPTSAPPVTVQSAEDGAQAIPAGFGLAVISGLADDVRVSSTSSGVSVQMSWPSAATTA
jgi:serine/threonine-protein kinase RsbW